MKLSCSVHGEFRRFTVIEFDEGEDGWVVYQVVSGNRVLYGESARLFSVEELAKMCVALSAVDGLTNVREEV